MRRLAVLSLLLAGACGDDKPAAGRPGVDGGGGGATADGPRASRDAGAPDGPGRGDGPARPRDGGGGAGGAGAGGSRPADGGAGAGGTSGELVPVFVAQGYMARTTISCDDGQTWIADRSDDDALRCFAGGIDCDHNGGRAQGVTVTGGFIVATWGWGEGNSVRRSADGRTFARVLDGTVFAGIEAGGGRIAVIADQPRVSLDHGATWQTAPAPMGFAGNIRATGVVGGTFVAAGGDSVGLVMVSSDGLAWRRPTEIPAGCGGGVIADGIGASDTTLVITHGSGRVCVSSDGGDHFTSATAPAEFSGSVLWTGSELLGWGQVGGGGRPVRLRSTDGLTWTTDDLVARSADGSPAAIPKIETVARSAAGTFVTVEGEWDQWYERQRFYRSTDGITWQELPRTAFVGSHPIRFLTWGLVDASACR